MFVVVLIVGWLGGFNAAQAQIITGISRGGSSTNPPPIIAPNSLAEDELSFVDRTHQYNSIPIGLHRAEYVMVANDDKVQADYSLNVTLSQSARLYLFLDNRLGHGATVGGDPNMNPDLWTAGMGWVYTNGFTDTGLNIGIDEGGDGQINQYASVYVRKSQAGTFTLFQQNDFTNPTGRNMYGVAALKSKLFEAFWFDNGKLNLVQTPDWVTVSSGFHAGPDWFWDDIKWHSPFEIEDNSWGVSKWRPYIAWAFFWDVDVDEGGEETWPGGGKIWSFVTHLTLQYTDPNVCPIHRWFFLWDKDPNGQGSCLEVTTGDAGLSSPLDPNIIDHLIARDQTYIVNTKIRNVFSRFELIRTDKLEEYVRGLMPAEDVQTFMSGDVINHLNITDPCSQGYVGIQRASWTHPEPTIRLSTGQLEITEGETISYGVSLREPPVGPVTVIVKNGNPAAIKWADYDDEFQLHFDRSNYNEPQVVSMVGRFMGDAWGSSSDQAVVSIAGKYFFDEWIYGRPALIAHYMDNDPTETTLLPVTIKDKKTGGLGYAPTDFNRDAITNLVDVAYVANAFLESTEQPQLFAPLTNPDEFTGVGIGIDGGSASFIPQTGTWIVTADGTDIWGTSDQFHFVYQDVCDIDFQVTATVTDLEDTHEWAKAGIMLRDELTQDSAYSMIAVTPGRGLAFQVRYNSGETTVSMHGGPAAHLKVPISLRLVAIGHTVTGYYYADGMWIKLGATTVECKCYGADNAGHVGLAVTSHVEGTPTTATFGSELVSLGP